MTACPACGVAVVPGYVRCPRCQTPLVGGRKAVSAGGTAVASRGMPLVVVGGAIVLALGIVLVVLLRGGDDKPASTAASQDREAPAAPADEAASPTSQVVTPELPEADSRRIDANAVARDLERVLRRQRLWSSVEVVGDRVDVRSGSCRDADLGAMVDAAQTALRDAGLTRLRCLEQSGAIVFEREL